MEEGCWRRALGGPAGRAAGEGLRGGAVGTHLLLYLNLHRNPSAQLTQGGLRNACSSLEVEKLWGTLGAGWKPRKKLATQGTQQTAPVCKRQFQKGRGSLRDRLDGCWRLLRKKMPQGPTGSGPGAYGHTERAAEGPQEEFSPLQVSLGATYFIDSPN